MKDIRGSREKVCDTDRNVHVVFLRDLDNSRGPREIARLREKTLELMLC